MGTELSETQGKEVIVVNPVTGEAIDLASDATDYIAEKRREVTDLKDALNGYAMFLDQELTDRLDRANTRSARVGDWKIETAAPTTTAFDPTKLAEALRSLIGRSLLDIEVHDKVLIPQPDKVSRAEVNKLLKHANAEVREAIEACGEEREQPRRVTVKPA